MAEEFIEHKVNGNGPNNDGAQLNNAAASNKDIATSALPIMEKLLGYFPGATQSQWAEDLMMYRLTNSDGKKYYAEHAEKAFVIQGITADLIAISQGRPRLREVFQSSGPSYLSEVPDFAKRFFEDANEAGVFSKAGRIETGVARRRVRYTNEEMTAAIDTVKSMLSVEEQKVLDLMYEMLTNI
jgi:hypothetical protein